MIEKFIKNKISIDLLNLDAVAYDDLEEIRNQIVECIGLFHKYYFTVENTKVGVRKYSSNEQKTINATVRTMYKDSPFACLENGWILGNERIHFCFNSPQDFSLTYSEMSNVTWHEVSVFFNKKCSFCNPSGFYVGVDCNRMGEIQELFKNFPSSQKKWQEKLNGYIESVDKLLRDKLSDSKTNFLSELDKDSNGEIDLIENDFNKIIVKNQKQIVEIDRNYIQQFVRISNYIKTKRANTQRIFESINSTKNQKELEARVGLVKNQIHAYEQLVFHSISMVSALLSDDMITFYEIYEAFDKLGIYNSNWENEVSQKLTGIGNNLNSLLIAIDNLENTIVNEFSNLSYITSESFSSLQHSVDDQLKGIQSSISVNNLLNGIQSYQLYKLNKKLLS